ncbi:hypothetical protein HK103_006517 [Boothiomyces macroporosus]|uniref:Uncharacterized protein n=1 Tax=Boothiomyces macroporosus TaxID=261099 RepID=A0AAD5Y5W7_9FUNG|nr:hypothetical protein HK103_006517 [Boothiomyces macroporosus]
MKLYIDGLNYKRRFWRVETYPWNLKAIHKQISLFVKACQNSKIETVVFLDATRQTSEAIKKNKQRHALAIRKGKFTLPFGSTLIYGEIFKSLGVKVYYSCGADNDDTLAAFAQRDGAAVLSKDQDFFRYRDRAFKIYSDFTFKKGKLTLEEAEFNDSRSISKRDIIEIPKVVEKLPRLADLPHFVRFTPVTPLTKYYEANPVAAYRPLRQALYHKFGVSEIEERYPDVDSDGNTTWINLTVNADPTFSHLLLKPDIAVKKFMGEFLKKVECDPHQWALHEFGVYYAIYEIYYLAVGGSINFYNLMVDVAQPFLAKPKDVQRNGQNQKKSSRRKSAVVRKQTNMDNRSTDNQIKIENLESTENVYDKENVLLDGFTKLNITKADGKSKQIDIIKKQAIG